MPKRINTYELKRSLDRLGRAMSRSQERLRAKESGHEVTMTGQILPKPNERGATSPLGGLVGGWYSGEGKKR